MSEIIEEWRWIVGYEGMYQVSNIGRVKSFQKGKEIIMKQKLTKYGYYEIGLRKNGIKRKWFRVNRLVYIAFIGDIPIDKVVNHINGDKKNNRVDNLNIKTQRENMSTCHRNDRDTMSSPLPGASWSKSNKKWHSKIVFNVKVYSLGYFDTDKEASDKWYEAKSHIENGTFKEYILTIEDKRTKSVNQYSMSGEFMRSWNRIKDASEEIKINQSGISECCNGKQNSAGNFKWSYKEKEED